MRFVENMSLNTFRIGIFTLLVKNRLRTQVTYDSVGKIVCISWKMSLDTCRVGNFMLLVAKIGIERKLGTSS